MSVRFIYKNRLVLSMLRNIQSIYLVMKRIVSNYNLYFWHAKTRNVLSMIGNKRGQGIMVLKVIFAVIIFAILAYATFSAIRKILPSDRAGESFDELIEKIKKAEEGLQSTPLYMDKNTLIVIFDGNKKIIETYAESIPKVGGIPFIPSRTTNYRNYNLNLECTSGLCACLCKNYEDYGEPEDNYIYTISCESSVCQQIGELNYLDSKCAARDGTCSGGNIIQRFEAEQRIRAVYIEKSGNNVGICLDPPCLRWGGAGGNAGSASGSATGGGGGDVGGGGSGGSW